MAATQLSPNFSLTEFTKSRHALKGGIANTPSPEHLVNLYALAALLEQVRAHFKKPVVISSGYRNQEVNKLAGSKNPKSQHTTGEAADFEIPGVANADIWRFIDEHCEFDQLIGEYLEEADGTAGWIHVSISLTRPQRKDAKSCIGGERYPLGLHFV